MERLGYAHKAYTVCLHLVSTTRQHTNFILVLIIAAHLVHFAGGETLDDRRRLPRLAASHAQTNGGEAFEAVQLGSVQIHLLVL